MKTFLPLSIFALLILHAIISLLVMNPDGPEAISDEPVYITLSKSLASDREYRTISLPGEPYHTKYPILLPWLLSLVWQVSGEEFPANVIQFRLVSLFFGVGGFVVWFLLLSRIWRRTRSGPLLVIVLCAVHPATISNSISILSESTYFFLSGLALLMLLEWERKGGRVMALVRAAVLQAGAFYVRTSGVALLGASFCYLALKKQLKEAVLCVGIATLLILPWIYWSYAHNEAARYPEYVFYSSYLSDFLHLLEVKGLIELLMSNCLYLLFGIPKILIYPFETDLGHIAAATAWLGLPALLLGLMGFLRSYREGLPTLIHWYVIGYLAMLLFWPYPAHERFLSPLLPLFYFFIAFELFNMLEQIRNFWKRHSRFWMTSILVVLPLAWLAVSLGSLGRHTYAFVQESIRRNQERLNRERDMHESFRWIRSETKPTDHLMAYLDPVYYLYTDRKTAPLMFESGVDLAKPKFDEEALKKYGIKFLIRGELDFGVFTDDVVQARRREIDRIVLTKRELKFKKVFTSSRGKFEIFKIEDGNGGDF